MSPDFTKYIYRYWYTGRNGNMTINRPIILYYL